MIEQTTTYDLTHVKDVQLKGADKFFDVWILDTNTLVANKQRLSDYSTNGGRQICCLDTDNDVRCIQWNCQSHGMVCVK